MQIKLIGYEGEANRIGVDSGSSTINLEKNIINTGDRQINLDEVKKVVHIEEGEGEGAWIAQGEYSNESEAMAEYNALISQKPDLEQFTYQVDEFILVKNSTKSKAKEAVEFLKEDTAPIETEVFQEEDESTKEKVQNALQTVDNIGKRFQKIYRQ